MKNKKIFVIDTNVLLTDPLAFMSFSKGDTVVIPYKTIEELEKHKLSSFDTGNTARDCSRRLNEVLADHYGSSNSLFKGIKLENGSILRVVSSRQMLTKDRIAETVGELTHGDDFILGACIAVKDESPDKTVVLVSNDMNLKIRASSFGVEVEPYEQSGHLKNLDDLYSGNRVVDFDEETLSRYWECQKEEDEYEFNVDSVSGAKNLKPNEFVVHRSDRKPYVILRKKPGMTYPVVVKEKGLEKIKALNIEQTMAIDLLTDPKVDLVTLVGKAGTGKTLIALEAGLKQVMSDKRYEKLIILRPVHSVGKEIGFLPGLKEEKLEPWIAPIKDNLKFLLSKEKPTESGGKKMVKPNVERQLDHYFEKGIIEIEAMSFIRGRSINNAYIIVEEAQNTNHHEIKTILTRVGYGTKVVMTGDIEQSDRNDLSMLNNGMAIVIDKFKDSVLAGHITLTKGVRSPLSAEAATIL